MKKNLRSVSRLFVCAGFLLFNAHLAQSQGLSKGNYKADQALRSLTSTTASARMARKDVSALQVAKPAQAMDGYVAIDAYSKETDGKALLEQLQKLGLKNGSSYKKVVSGFFPVDKIEKLEGISSLNHASPAYTPQKGLVTSEGDGALKADVARQQFGVTGLGSKIGVISDSYGVIPGGVAAGVASGDLPADVQVLSDSPTGTDEGRAMAEIVHDVAPGAKIAFHTANPGQAAFANGILGLADAGCNIVVDDIIYLAEPMFQDGIIAQAVDEVVKRNVSYFSAAGNNARKSYQAPFRNSGVTIPGWGEAHNFGNGDLRQSITIPARSGIQLMFQWSDDFYSVSGGAGAKTDLDLLVYFNNVLFTASAQSNEGRDPYEYIALNNNGNAPLTIEIAVVKYSGPDPQLIKWIDFGNGVPTEHVTNSSTVYGHANAQGAIAVGAVAWFNTPQYNANLTRPVINNFSSLGGTPVLLSTTGQESPYTTQRIRMKPEVVGPDGGNNTFFGSDTPVDADSLPNFFGTSAAAPHVAAVAALMQEKQKGQMSPGAILDKLKSTAIDMDNPYLSGFSTGFDFMTGYGFVQADAAVATAGTKANQTITFLEIPDRKITDPRKIKLEAYSTSNLPVEFTVLQGPAYVEGDSLVITGRGVVRIKAAQWGNPEFRPAMEVIQEFVVEGVAQTISFGPLPDVTYGVGPIPLVATSTSGLPVVFRVVTGVARIVNNLLIVEGTGKITVMATQPGNSIYEAAPSVTQTFTVSKATQTISFAPIPDKTLGDAPFMLEASATSGLPVTFTVLQGPAKVSGNMVTLHGTGKVRIKATQYGNGVFAPASEVIREFMVYQAVATLQTSSVESVSAMGQGVQLGAYPNPFMDRTAIAFSAPENGEVLVDILSPTGALVKSLHKGQVTAGSTYQYEFDGSGKANGVYICRIIYNGKVEFKRLVLAR
ncbi:S8 family serine peptidase [Rufibacter sp. XAAS-G3-1]|uniref:S8 family serine peptidase n=1 Tax=Rufibacter sp. XAAS-G3-1 TaxID=2729134 RepID=UPI0015E68F1C|nr:S8 family serine peptidase [Rufibacter sp. XAAS-G3-1]